MSAIPCQFSVTCDCTDFPITNYSAEGPEQVQKFQALVFPESWDKQGCLTLCESTVSQQDADLCALAQAASCNPPIVTTFNPNDPNEEDGGDTFSTLFFSAEQSCTRPCPDGTDFSYTLPAGKFSATTQEAADARALAYACQLVGDKRVCISALDNTGACIGVLFEGTSTVTVFSGLVPTATISAGALPDGITMTLAQIAEGIYTLTFTGIISAIGQYDFTVLVTDTDGNQMSKDFSLFVVTITESSLPDGTFGTPYSQTLTDSGPTLSPVTWDVTAGALPAGLSLDASTGVISGTPSEAGVFTFTISMTDAR